MRCNVFYIITLCPAPLADNTVYPNLTITEKRKASGCIFLAAALDNSPLASDAVVKISDGASIFDFRWLSDDAGHFYGGNDTGREVIIRGGSAGSDFKLEVGIAGATLTPKPYIHGKVLVPKTVQIRAYVICSNGVEAVSAATIEAWIAEANRIYRQVAITFTLAGSIQYIHGHETWFNIDDKDKFRDMCSYTNNTGGLELYCVNTLYGQANGLHSTLGMAVKFDAPMTTLAHEIGHACGLKDLYDYNAGDGLVSEGKAGALNWSGGVGTGYYPPTLAYRDLTYRCIMEMARPSAVRGDIPLDGLTAMDGAIRVPISVGLNQMTTREPQH